MATKATALIVILLCLAAVARADWLEAENLGNPVNTSSSEWYPVIARDGSFMIFVSDRPGGFGQSDLWISYRNGGTWLTPVNMGANVNSAFVESAPFLADNDTKLYFASTVPGGHGGMDVYWSSLNSGIPGAKTNMGPVINGNALDCCPVISTDGNTFYICSDRSGGYGSMDVWVSEQTGGVWSPPVNCGALMNSSQTDCPRWVSDDGDTLILSSTRFGGHGNADLWYTVREGGNWGPMVNFGPVINSQTEEWGPGFLDHQGAIGGTIYFGSARSGGHGGRDIWLSTEDSVGIPEIPPLPHLKLRVSPNPLISESVIAYGVPQAARVTIEIYDVQGRRLRSLYDASRAAGDYQLTWDGTGADGKQLPAGVYICRIQIGGEIATSTIVVTRD